MRKSPVSHHQGGHLPSVRSSTRCAANVTGNARRRDRRALASRTSTLGACPPPRRPATPDEELLGAERPAVVTERTEEERLERIRRELVAGYDALARRRLRGVGLRLGPHAARPPRLRARARDRRGGWARPASRSSRAAAPGIMEAANRGAQEAGARRRAEHRPAVRAGAEPLPGHRADASTTSSRARSCSCATRAAFVVFPGGFGTLDELFEALCSIQTGKIRHFPVVLVRSAFWAGLPTGCASGSPPTA